MHRTEFEYEGVSYFVNISASEWYDNDNPVELPSGQLVEAGSWNEIWPPQLVSVVPLPQGSYIAVEKLLQAFYL